MFGQSKSCFDDFLCHYARIEVAILLYKHAVMMARQQTINVPYCHMYGMQANRHQKAMQILEQQSVKRIDSSSYKVRSQTVGQRFYHVRIDEDSNYTCECGDFAFRKPIECKHIMSVKLYRQLIRREEKATIGKERPSQCPRCGHNKMNRDGVRKVKAGLKQRWECPKCSYKCVSSNVGVDVIRR